MAKRRRGSEDDDPHNKRQRLLANGSIQPCNDEILSVRQLQDLLAFNQDAGPKTRQSVISPLSLAFQAADSSFPDIHTFKVFLESIAYGDDAALQASRRDILLQYLKSQKTSIADTYASDLPQTWSFAAQSNNEGLYSAVTAVLALLLKTISNHLEFQETGRGLCDLLLEKDHLKLLERGLSAERTKEHVISPCLRLLTQIVSFDGGGSAKRVYRNKNVTFKRLDTFLSLRQDPKGLETKSRRKIPVRNVALQYLFANLRFQDHAIKTDILAHGRTLRSMFQDIKDDPPSIVQQLLRVMKDDILKDEKIPRRVKGRLFTDQVLSSVAALYKYVDNDKESISDENDREQQSISNLAHTFLLSLCTMREYGVLGPEGQYPGAENEELSTSVEDIRKYQETGPLFKRKQKRAAANNRTLSSFLQMLRPYASSAQRDLTLATFQAAPELIADYFYKKRAFSFEPKLTATWTGFATFLLSTIQMPLPDRLINSKAFGLYPAPISDIIECILPLPLSAKVVSRCLNQNVIMIKFFAIKILTAAFDKFAQTLRCFQSISRNYPGPSVQVWDTAALELLQEFGQRCPDMNHVIMVFRSCSSKDTLLREASARLLSLYYQHLPQTALEQKFDASTALSTVFDEISMRAHQSVEPSLASMVLTHLLYVARCSPDMRWWQKSEHDQLSLFGSGLRLCAILGNESRGRSLEALLQSALSEGLSLNAGQKNLLLAILLKSIVRSEEQWRPSDALFKFLDGCLTRLTQKTVRYQQDLLGYTADLKHTASLASENVSGEFLMVIVEQWPFVQDSTLMPDTENIRDWLTRFLLVLVHNGGDVKFIDCVRGKIKALTSQQDKTFTEKPPDGHFTKSLDVRLVPSSSDGPPQAVSLPVEQQQDDQAASKGWQPPSPPACEGEDHPGLGKWKQLGLEEAVADGALGELMLCFCSEYADIRKQALIELRIFMKALQTSQYSEREPLHLLIAELAESCKEYIAETALPYFAGVMAAESCLILSDPLHILYTKINRFLNKGPVWKVEKLPSYWVDQILIRLPTVDDAHYREVGWLLNLLGEGLRTTADMELYRRCHILERLLSLMASPSLPSPQQEKLLELLYRCGYADGSTTLITRCSLPSWVPCRIASGYTRGLQTSALEGLVERCLQDCDQKRVHEWSGGKLL
ncbi:MAG: hypothetical protein Q9186_004734 [Xanthomendoza sp. 1 TL-2023]